MEKRTVLITGASGEIGGSIAKVLINEGWQVLLHYNENQGKISELIADSPEEAVLGFIKADLGTSDGISHFLKHLHFPIDAFVHASGKALYGTFQQMTDTNMEEMIQLHVQSPWKITRHILPDMLKKRFGHIVMISSIWGEKGASNEVLYSSVKGAQNSFVKALAKETALSGISVNAVSPGLIQTKMNNFLDKEEMELVVEDIPAGRAGDPEEIANVVSFLLSPKASYINGQVINVNGAWN
ncbi:3-oxoacyl-[acyl-carrier protein] reductase [Salirhabdus euzebyi]|uniref:3-oxoacyl-[acyl-carrier protein] reductase n=1 Tax=Salirhabdus euzebyi TaxID=394506 RepID=A0A841Q394_9BACI|nr:SDR family oxidoreductase [Salirhabdus euzebyi]MBB6452857.1 3-oxoacyl-[acyl-carrier protein] reductase [Salirhabdus euzebyi]